MKRFIDPYTPARMARRVLDTGVSKAKLSIPDTLALAILAGAFIAMGAAFATLAMTDTGLGFGPTKVLGGLAFSLGLILVMVGGAELFTGNNLIAMAWASGAIPTRLLLRNWFLVYIGNFIGALATAIMMLWTGIWGAGAHSVGATAIRIAVSKTELGFTEAFVRGILCNALVCLAIWLCQSARSTTDKILAIVWPVTAFVALGFEHSIANMYFISLGMLLKSYPDLSGVAQDPTISFDSLTFIGFANNLIPVTLGNMVGGTLLVAAIYWSVYLRSSSETSS